MKDMIFILNPRSGKEQIKNQLLGILDLYCAAGYLPSVHVTQSAEDAEQVAAQYGEKTEILVCSGGDGTLNNVITGIAGLSKKPKICYIPAGSTNDFARSLKIPADMKQAAGAALSGKTARLDIGRFGDDRYFVYVAAFGALTEVSYTTPQDKKNFLGHPAYLLESVKHLSSLKAHTLRAVWENGEISGDFIFGMVTNTTSVGGFKGLVSQEVSFDDGLFEVLLIRMPKTAAELSNIVSYMFLKEEENEYVFRFKASRIEFWSEVMIPWVLDGEFGGVQEHVVIENLRQEAEFFVGE